MQSLDLENLAYCAIDGTLIFLDITADRYFSLSNDRNREVLATIDLSASGSWHQPVRFPTPPEWIPPRRACAAMHLGPFQMGEVARALWMQRRIERRLTSTSLAKVVSDLRDISSIRTNSRPITDKSAIRVIRAFEQARLLRTAADRCLPRSIALALCLATRGVRVQVVIGVKLAQFGAHCWVQSGDEVLNDSAEEAMRHSPILVI